MAKIEPSGKFKRFAKAMGKSKAALKVVDRVARANSSGGAVFKGEVDKAKVLATKPASLSNRKLKPSSKARSKRAK